LLVGALGPLVEPLFLVEMSRCHEVLRLAPTASAVDDHQIVLGILPPPGFPASAFPSD
jgi:hypothetical protein